MARPFALFVALLLAAAEPGSTMAQGKPSCEMTGPGYDSHDIKCSLHGTGATQRLRFKANFSGSHDDTMASMTVTLDGAPLACDKGSKTSLMGEDGEVSLECRFSISEKAGTNKVLDATVSWRHAQFKDFELGSD